MYTIQGRAFKVFLAIKFSIRILYLIVGKEKCTGKDGKVSKIKKKLYIIELSNEYLVD